MHYAEEEERGKTATTATTG